MSLFKTPPLGDECTALLEEAKDLRNQLATAVSSPSKWVPRLRRQAESQSYSSSTRIEGYVVSTERAEAIVGGGATSNDENEQAFAGYLDAMRFVEAAVADQHFALNRQLILALHFMACGFQRDKHPGRLRAKQVQVVDANGRSLYDGPRHADLSDLIDEFVVWVSASRDQADPLVLAAMAHLQLVSLHPFEDGNGRVSRIVQSAVLAAAGPVQPAFGSIEPFLADNTASYYAVLQEVQRGSFQPDRSALPWIKFCLGAHIAQATERIEQVAVAATRWSALEDLVGNRGWPERLVVALEMAMTIGLERSTYASEAEIAIPTASNDLRRLVDSGLVGVSGGGRSTRYHATEELKRLV